MSYTIIWDEVAREFLRKIHQDEARRIINKVNSIVDDPRHYLESLVDITAYKLRIGDHRIIIDIHEDTKTLFVVLIGHRKDIYKTLKRTGFRRK